MVQIALLKQELVTKARWVSQGRFEKVLALYQALPGPEAMELCVYFGMVRRGRFGAFLAGLGFLLPGVTCMLIAAILYAQQQFATSDVQRLLQLMQPVVVALIFRAAWQIGRGAVVSVFHLTVALAAFTAELVGVPFWLSLPFAGLVMILSHRLRIVVLALCVGGIFFVAMTAGSHTATPLLPPTSDPASLAALASMGLKAGLLSFGGAYAALPFLEMEAVGKGWISLQALVDGVAVNSLLPAPLVSVGSFVGYLAFGLSGALVVTAMIFLPAFAFTMLFHDAFERMIDHEQLQRALLGVTVAVVGLIGATACRAVQGLHFTPVEFLWVIACLGVLLSIRRVLITPLLLLSVAALRSLG